MNLVVRGLVLLMHYNGGAGGDLGGASYGTYQLASFLPAVMTTGKARPSAKNSPVIQFLNTLSLKISLQD
jgi:hypothetical protein